MSDFGLIYRVRQGFPDATAAIDEYQEAKDDRQSRSLARHLAVEATLYDQFVRKLLLRSHCASVHDACLEQRIKDNLGTATANLLSQKLQQLEKLLRTLEADLANTSRGKEVLSKLRLSEAKPRTNTTASPLQRRLAELSRANKELTSYLADWRAPLPMPTGLGSTPNFPLFFHRDRDASAAVFQVMSKGYVCDCQGFHAANFGVKCPTCSSCVGKSDPWRNDSACEFLFPPRLAPGVPTAAIQGREAEGKDIQTPVSASIDALGRKKRLGKTKSARRAEDSFYDDTGDQTEATGDSGATDNVKTVDKISSRVDNVRPIITSADEQNHISQPCIGKLEKELRVYLDQITSGQPTIPVEDLISPKHIETDHKQRMEFAFQLCIAVIRLMTTSWVDSSWAWNDWAVTFGQRGENSSSPCTSLKLCSVRLSVEKTSQPKETWRIPGIEPILAKLGFSIIELAFSRSLAKIRRNYPSLFCEEDMQMLDSDTLDFLTAKKLLALGWIGDEFGPDFEDAVNACINQQYREIQGALIKDLNTQSSSFLRSAALAIMTPLYREVCKYFGSHCTQTHFGDDERAAAELDHFHDAETDGERLRTPITRPTVIRTDRGSEASSSPAVDKIAKPLVGVGSFSPQGDVPIPQLPDKAQEPPVALPKSSVDEINSKSSEDLKSVPQKKLATGPVPSNPSGREQLQRNHDSRKQQQSRHLSSHASDFGAGSNYSYRTSSASIDTAFSFLSNHSSTVPDLPANHPFMKVKNKVLAILLAGYQDGSTRMYGSGSSGMPGSSSPAESTKPGQRPESDRDDSRTNEDNSSTPRSTLASKTRPPKEEKECFACPFLKQNPPRNRACCGYKLTRIRDVKQHIGRCHQMPIYCPICYETFRDEDTRDTHVRGRACDQTQREKPEGVTAQQKTRLGKKAPSNQTPEEQWYGIFEILFPDHSPRPETPYISSGFLQDVLGYQDFLLEQGPDFLRDFMINQGVVPWNQPNLEDDLAALQRRLIQEGIRALFDLWTSQGGINTLEIAGTDTTSDPTPSSSTNESIEVDAERSAVYSSPAGTASHQSSEQSFSALVQPFQYPEYTHSHSSHEDHQNIFPSWGTELISGHWIDPTGTGILSIPEADHEETVPFTENMEM